MDLPGRGDDGFTASTYGAGFADVYDEWYPADDETGRVAARIGELAGPAADVLELGVGTGRIAVELATGGHRVVGLDASTDMLDRLGAKLAADDELASRIHPTFGDVRDPDAWPSGPFDVVLAACNLVCNVVDPSDQRRVVHTAATVLRPGGWFLVEAFLPAPLEDRGRDLSVRQVAADRVVLIATDTDPSTGVVTGQHIDLVDGGMPRLRPWQVRATQPAELDQWATEAGFELVERRGDWAGTPFAADGAGHVSSYRRT